METINCLAIDLGAGSGRGIIGSFDGDELNLNQISRFKNRSLYLGKNHIWDFSGILQNVKNSIKAASKSGVLLTSVGIDSWAQDFGLLDKTDALIGNVHTYRDERTQSFVHELSRSFSDEELFNITGLTSHPICTLLQLMSMQKNQKDEIGRAKTLLFIADLVNFFLTGEKRCNTSVAALSLLYDPMEKNWSKEIIEKTGIPKILPELIAPGNVLGSLKKEMTSEFECKALDVIAVTSHDTLSALDFLPEQDTRVLISSGTWSVLGCRTDKPKISKEPFKKGFINELGYKNQNYLLKNITGLWIVQEVTGEWEKEENYKVDFNRLNDEVYSSDYTGYIDVDEPEFAMPGNMQKKIHDYLVETRQPLPSNKPELIRCILLGLALKYKKSIEDLQKILNKKFEAINIVGGGAKNTALNKITAEVCGMPVYAGPYEATATGNILCQLITKRYVGSVEQAGEIIKRSFDICEYIPDNSGLLDALLD